MIVYNLNKTNDIQTNNSAEKDISEFDNFQVLMCTPRHRELDLKKVIVQGLPIVILRSILHRLQICNLKKFVAQLFKSVSFFY